MLLSICGGITAISAAIAVIIKAINHAKAPDDKQNERLNAHDAEFEKVNRKLSADKDRLDLFQSKLVSLEEHQKKTVLRWKYMTAKFSKQNNVLATVSRATMSP